MREQLKREWAYMPAMARVAFVLISAVIFAVVFGPLLLSTDPTTMNLSSRFSPPSSAFWLGSDELGRDLLARLLYGGRISLGMSVGVVATGLFIGVTIGLWCGLVQGWWDTVVMRFIDVMLALPPLVLAMALAAALGPGLFNAMLALVIVSIPTYVRFARAQALQLRGQSYLHSARLAGASETYLLRVHVLPNSIGPLIVQGTMDVAGVMLASAALGFIGLGAQPPTPEWGGLISTGQQFVKQAWWYPLMPGLAILFCAICCNILGDSIRDRLDPKAN